MIVRDGGAPRSDVAAADDLAKGVDGKGRRSVRSGKKVRVHFERGARLDLRTLVHTVRPDDLLRARHAPCGRAVREHDVHGLNARPVFPSPDLEDAAAPADFLFLWRERHRFVALPLRAVPERPRRGIEFEFVPVLCVGDGFRALDEVKAQVQRVPTKDVPHARPAYDDHRASRLLGDRLQPRRGHLARGADGEAVSRDEEGLPRVNARAKARHEIPEGAFLPALVQRGEALGDAILGGRDLVGVDGVALLPGTLGVPKDERASAHRALAHRIPRAM